MELHKLKYFHTAAKLEHVTKAAEELHIAQPSLTKAIHQLEDELGVPLLRKNGRRIELTEYGEYLKRRLDTILPEIDKLPEELDRLKLKADKTVKLNILAASHFVINAIMRYRKLRPDVVFDLEQNDTVSGCDIVITTNGQQGANPGSCIRRCVKKERIYLAVPKDSPYAARESVELSEVRDEGFVMLSSSRLFGVICEKFCAAAGFSPKIMFESDSPVAVQNIISMGTGAAFWPEYSWGKMKNRNIRLMPISSPDCRRDLIFELHERQPVPEYAAEFYEFLLGMI